MLGLGEAGENIVEGGIAIDQQRHIVAVQERAVGEALHGLVVGHPFQAFHRKRLDAFLHGGPELFDLARAAAKRLHVAFEVSAAQDPVRGHREIGEGVETDAPGDGALGGSGGHHGVD